MTHKTQHTAPTTPRLPRQTHPGVSVGFARHSGTGQARRPGPSRLPRHPPRGTPHGLRIAAIDIGTNSMHMVIVEVTEGLSFRVLSSERELTQLGSALVRHRLTLRAMVHTNEVLSRYQRIARQLDCDVVLAYATSAVRECQNGGDFVELLKLDLGLDIQVISAQEEARLIYLAVRQALEMIDAAGHPSLALDIGGGSAEFIVGTGEKALLLQSRKVGASRLAQEFVTTDPISKADLRRLEDHLEKTVGPVLTQVRALGASRIIGTSGTMENLAAMCLAQHGQDIARHRVVTDMTRQDFRTVYKRLRRANAAQRRRIPGLDPGRAEQIVAGAALVDFVFRHMGAERIEVCDRALREGMIIDYMQQHWPKVKLSVQVRDPRRRSVIELGRRCNYDEPHARQVTKIALELFDQLKRLHGLGDEERELLEYAALVHDVGWHIGHIGHHKHSYYLIKNGELEGFTPVEIELMANVARYHRRSLPKKSHEAYMALRPEERAVVRKLGALLRIADGLDRGHHANVERVKARLGPRTIGLKLYTHEDAELELWAARHKVDMFEQVYAKRLNITAAVLHT